MIGSRIDLAPNFEDYEFDDRERKVLKLFANEQNANFSFQGLRRRLGFHQETLTRTLKRLEEAEVIERTPEGYRMKGAGSALSFTVNTNQSTAKPIIDAYLPAQVDVTILFQRLRGRWFSNFRWLGYSNDGDAVSMSWISEDGQMQLQARIGEGKVAIAASPGANTEESRAVAAAYQLFDHVSKIAEELVRHPNQAPVIN